MTRRWFPILVLLLCGLMFTTIYAQDDHPSDALRVPSAAEYMITIPPLLTKAWAEGQSQSGIAFARVVSDEIIYRYFKPSPAADYALLKETYGKLMGAGGPQSVDPKTWQTALIQVWLRENRIDLTATNELQIDNGEHIYKSAVSPQDFDGDGQPEWILELTDQQSGQMNYLVAKSASNQQGDYQLIQTPILWFHNLPSGLEERGTVRTWQLQDITGDGQIDWLLTIGSIAGNGGIHFNYGWLEVLTWQQGQLVSLTPHATIQYKSPSGGGLPIIPHGITLDLLKLPDHRDQQISVQQVFNDNWGCSWTRTQTYACNGTLYNLSQQIDVLPDTADCAWRQAELVMEDHNYSVAIRHYEHGLSLSPPSVSNQYMRFRLALAYSLTEQFNSANQLVTALQTEAPTTPLIKDVITALNASLASTSTPIAICTAVYDVFKRYHDSCYQNGDYSTCSVGDPYGGVVGTTVDNIEAYADAWYWIPDPASAGCDPSSLQAASAQTSTPIPTPVAQPISFSSELQAVERLLFSGRPTEALARLDQAEIIVAAVGEMSATDAALSFYLRAVALELSGDLNGAVNTYRLLKQKMPHSVWAALAALHLND